MKNKLQLLAATLLLALTTAIGASAANVTGVDINSDASIYTGTGVLDASSRAWTLADSNGDGFLLGANKIKLTFTNANKGSDSNADLDLFDDYMHNNGNTELTIRLDNVEDFRKYNLVIYGAQYYNNRGGKFQLTEPASEAKTTSGDQQSTFEEGVNYVRFDDIEPVNGYILISVTNGPDNIGIINGFELQSTTDRNYDWVVNGDFYKGDGSLVYAGNGVLDDSGTTWNDVFTNKANLVDSEGNARNVSVELYGAWPPAEGPKDRGAGSTVNDLTRDFAWDSDAANSPNGTTVQMTLVFSGLRTIETYDLALFGVDKSTQYGATFTINGLSKKSDGDLTLLNGDKFAGGSTHVLFTGLTPASGGTITVTITANDGDFCMINGFQLGKINRTPAGTVITIK